MSRAGFRGAFFGPGGTPSMVIQMVIDDAQARARMDDFQRRLFRLESYILQMQQRTQAAAGGYVRTTNAATSKMIQMLRRWRWEIITVMFFLRTLGNVSKAAMEQIGESAENAATRGGLSALAASYEVDAMKIAAAIRSISNESISVMDSVRVVQTGLLVDQGEFSNQYAKLWEAARVAAVTSGKDATDVFEAMIESLVAGSGEALDSAVSIYQVGLALDKYAASVGVASEDLERMEAVQVIMSTILGRTNELMDEGAGAALEQKDSLDRLASQWEIMKDVFGAAEGELLRATGASDFFNESLETLNQSMLIFIASTAAWIEVGKTFSKIALFDPTGILELATVIERGDEAFARVFKAGAEAMGYGRRDVDEGGYVYERRRDVGTQSLDPLIDHMMKREDLIERHNQRMAKIDRDYADKRMDIERNLGQRMAQIERRAAQSEARARRRNARRVLEETTEYMMKQRQELEKHLLKESQKRREFRTRQLQDEALYQYERGLLVAEGDVLAIEDLDARYALEKAAKEENHRLDLVSDDEEFKLAQRQRRERFDEELAQLRAALLEQLQEIDERREEQRLEAEIQAQEERDRALREYRQRQDDQKAAHEQSLEDWNQYWAKLAERTKVGAQAITQILREYLGEGGEVDRIIKDFTTRRRTRLDLRRIIEGAVGPLPRSETEIERTRRYELPDNWSTQAWEQYSTYATGMQHGGSRVFNRPTLLPVAERGRPELVTATPMYGGGGNVSLSWAGGAIPVHGSGGLSGMDLSGVGDAIASGLVIEIARQLSSRRGGV